MVCVVDLEIQHVVEGDFDLLTPIGELDLATYAQLRDRINDQLNAGRANLVLDLTGASFLDSTALGLFIGARRRTYSAGGSFTVICSASQMRLFTLTKLDKVFDVRPSLEDWRRSTDPARATAARAGRGYPVT